MRIRTVLSALPLIVLMGGCNMVHKQLSIPGLGIVDEVRAGDTFGPQGAVWWLRPEETPEVPAQLSDEGEIMIAAVSATYGPAAQINMQTGPAPFDAIWGGAAEVTSAFALRPDNFTVSQTGGGAKAGAGAIASNKNSNRSMNNNSNRNSNKNSNRNSNHNSNKNSNKNANKNQNKNGGKKPRDGK